MCARALGGLEEDRKEREHMLRLQELFLRGTSLCNIYNEGRCNSISALSRIFSALFITPSWDTMGMGGGDKKRFAGGSGLHSRTPATCAEAEPTKSTPGSGTSPQTPRGLHWPWEPQFNAQSGIQPLKEFYSVHAEKGLGFRNPQCLAALGILRLGPGDLTLKTAP